MTASEKQIREDQGYRHATNGNRTACPTMLNDVDYMRGFLRGYGVK